MCRSAHHMHRVCDICLTELQSQRQANIVLRFHSASATLLIKIGPTFCVHAGGRERHKAGTQSKEQRRRKRRSRSSSASSSTSTSRSRSRHSSPAVRASRAPIIVAKKHDAVPFNSRSTSREREVSKHKATSAQSTPRWFGSLFVSISVTSLFK